MPPTKERAGCPRRDGGAEEEAGGLRSQSAGLTGSEGLAVNQCPGPGIWLSCGASAWQVQGR